MSKFLKRAWQKWLPIAQIIGNFQAQLILTFFYVVILLPLAVVFRMVADPFNLRRKRKTSFEAWQHPEESLEGARKQY